MTDEDFKAQIEANLREAITEFFEAKDNPEDTVFLTLTQRDAALIQVALLITSGSFSWAVGATISLSRKLTDAIAVQKGGDGV